MDTRSSIEKLDTAELALERIRILAGIHFKNNLTPEETSLICTLIYETAKSYILPEA